MVFIAIIIIIFVLFILSIFSFVISSFYVGYQFYRFKKLLNKYPKIRSKMPYSITFIYKFKSFLGFSYFNVDFSLEPFFKDRYNKTFDLYFSYKDIVKTKDSQLICLINVIRKWRRIALISFLSYYRGILILILVSVILILIFGK